MEDTPPTGSQSRRSFLLKSLSPFAALWLQGCANAKSSFPGFSSSRTGVEAPGFDHPLNALSFGNESIVSSQLVVREVDTPIHVAEGVTTWHQKGVHPYAYRITGDAAKLSWEESRHLLHPPPPGLRSSVSLGGLGTGTLELRADGSLTNWQIFNNSPGEGEKVLINDAFFGIRTLKEGAQPQAFAIRTTPPASLPAIEGIGFAGAFPVTRLRLIDSRLPLSVFLYAYGSIDIQEPALCNMPAVVFSFLLSNPTQDPIQTSIMYNQPNYLKGTFRTERGLILSKSGDDMLTGEMCMGFASNLSLSSMVTDNLEDVWTQFSKNGRFESTSSLGLFAHGAVASNFVIEPGASRTVSLVLSWHFPNRSIAGVRVGNAYTQRYSAASEAHDVMISRLPGAWQSLNTWNAFLAGSSLPDLIQDGLRNSLAQLYKTSFCTSDGRWRAWDSFSDADVSSIEQTLYRALPLLFLNPDMLKSVLRACAVAQSADGHIPGALGQGQRHPMDSPDAPSNVRAIPAFFILSYAFYSYTGDATFLKELWPHLLKSLAVQLSITTPEGLPSNLPALSDWASMDQEGYLLNEAILHLTALHAITKMGEVIDREKDILPVKLILAAGQMSLQTSLGSSAGFKLATSASSTTLIERTRSRDLLPGFIWAGMLGFEGLFNPDMLKDFLEEIYDKNTPPIVLNRSQHSSHPASEISLSPAMSMNWAALNIQHSGATSRSFEVLSQLFEHQEKTMADGWGQYERLSFPDGQPLANPHHVSHLAIWFIIVALSGQQFDAANKKLTLNPRASNGARIPFFIPEAKGIITVLRSDRYSIQIISGRLELKLLEIGENIVYRDILLEEGQVLQLKP